MRRPMSDRASIPLAAARNALTIERLDLCVMTTQIVADVGKRIANLLSDRGVSRDPARLPAGTVADTPAADPERDHDHGRNGRRHNCPTLDRRHDIGEPVEGRDRRPGFGHRNGESAAARNRGLESPDSLVDGSFEGNGDAFAFRGCARIGEEEEQNRIEVAFGVLDNPPNRKGALGFVDGRRAAVDFPERLLEGHDTPSFWASPSQSAATLSSQCRSSARSPKRRPSSFAENAAGGLAVDV